MHVAGSLLCPWRWLIEEPIATEEVKLSAEEGRVVGSLIEKAMTTPDHYPMTLNGIVVACNQVSNRDPVVVYDEGLVERTLRELADNGLAKMVHRPGDRVVKYRQALDEVIGLTPRETSLLAVLMLRGSQTPGELRQRSGRYVDFASLPELEETLRGLGERTPRLVARLERAPGQKEHRYLELLTADGPSQEAAAPLTDPPAAPAVNPDASQQPDGGVVSQDMEELRKRLDIVESRLQQLMEELGLES